MYQHTIGIITTYTELLPVLAGLIVFTKAGLKHRLLVFFLIYGVISDFASWQYIDAGKKSTAQSLFYIYSLIEALFFFWFIYNTSDYQTVKKTAFLLLFIIPLAWTVAHVDFLRLDWKIKPEVALYNTIYEMTTAVLVSISILRITQKEEPMGPQPDFWFLTAIFFYCFCTFIDMSFLRRDEMPHVWIFHNLFNVITYFIYAFGFFKIEVRKS